MGEIHIFLIWALVGGEWSASRPYRFTSGERALGTHWIGGWVSPRTDLEDMEKPVGYTDCATPAPIEKYKRYGKVGPVRN
jgi:hypothetical protein